MVKNPPADAGDVGLIPGLGRSPGERNSNPLQYSCLENPTDREAWQAIVHGDTKESDTTERLKSLRVRARTPAGARRGHATSLGLAGDTPHLCVHCRPCSPRDLRSLVGQAASARPAAKAFPSYGPVHS